jgi:Ca-activated chloride channel family protein
MKDSIFKYAIPFLFIGFFSMAVFGQNQLQIKAEKPLKTRLLFVFDGSQSMYGRWQQQQKIEVARRLLTHLVDSLANSENIEMALRVYGDQFSVPPQVCEDSRLLVPFSPQNAKKITEALKRIVPKGTTPIAYALQQAANDFPACDNCRNIIILITDGIEECKGDPCAVSAELQKKGIMLKPFVIGIGKNFEAAFSCVGTYIEAKSEEDFSKALEAVVSQAMNQTSVQVNLLDRKGEPKTTNLIVSFYDQQSNHLKYNFVHTLNGFNVPDTIFIEPRAKYKVVVSSIPAVVKTDIQIQKGTHNTIALDVSVGRMVMELEGKEKAIAGLQAVVRQQGKSETLNVQYFGTTDTYLSGLYQVEVLSLPRMMLDSVKVSENYTTTVRIPGPGIVVIKKPTLGYGAIHREQESGLELIYNLRENINHVESLYLLPGKYRITFRSKFKNSTTSTKEVRFEVKTSETITLDIQ